jgi:hypothetical protein
MSPRCPRRSAPPATGCHRPGGRTGPSSSTPWRVPAPAGPPSDRHQHPARRTPPCVADRAPEALEPSRRRGSTPADRPLPVRLTQRPATRGTEQPRVGRLAFAPAVHDRHQVRDQWYRPAPVVLQGVHVQSAATAAGQHGTAQPQTGARNRHPVTDLKPGQLTPSEPGQRQHGHHVAVPAFARRRQRPQLIEGERLAVPGEPGLWLACEPTLPRCAVREHRPPRRRGWSAAWPGHGSP